MNYKTVVVQNSIPDARYKDVRARVTHAVLDNNNDVIGFIVEYSSLHSLNMGWVKFGMPSDKEDGDTDG